MSSVCQPFSSNGVLERFRHAERHLLNHVVTAPEVVRRPVVGGWRPLLEAASGQRARTSGDRGILGELIGQRPQL